jgi:hypothetical protein
MESIMLHLLSWLNPGTVGQPQRSEDLPCALDDNELETAAGGCKSVDNEDDNDQVFTGNPKDCPSFPSLF